MTPEYYIIHYLVEGQIKSEASGDLNNMVIKYCTLDVLGYDVHMFRLNQILDTIEMVKPTMKKHAQSYRVGLKPIGGSYSANISTPNTQGISNPFKELMKQWTIK